MAEAERITINIAAVDAGMMDLLIDDGVYATRSDFVRAAIRTQLSLHKAAVEETSTRKKYIMGTEEISGSDLEAALVKKQKVHYRVIGALRLSADITPELACATIGSISVYGSLRVSDEVRAALGDRILR